MLWRDFRPGKEQTTQVFLEDVHDPIGMASLKSLPVEVSKFTAGEAHCHFHLFLIANHSMLVGCSAGPICSVISCT